MSGFHRKFLPFSQRGRSLPALAALMALMALAGCKSRVEKADAYEASYDQYLGRQAYVPAMVSIRNAVQQDENEPRRWLKLAHVQDLLNNPAAAAAAYQRALDLEPYNIEALQNLAILTVRGGQYEAATHYVDQLLLLQPNDLTGLFAQGTIALHDRRYKDADAIAGQLIAAAPNQEEGYIMRARARDLAGQSADATKLLEQRLSIDPDNRDLLHELLNVYRRHGNRDGIRRMAVRLMPLYPDDPRYALESVRAYHAMKRDDEARRIIAGLTQRYGRNVSVMTAVAGLWRDMEPPAVAGDAIGALAAKSPPRVRLALADILTAMGEPARVAALLGSVATAPVTVENIDAQASYARALYALGRMDEARRKIDAILGFDGTNPVALLLRARLELAKGDYPKAATDAGVVASDDNTNEEAALLLASIYAAQGNQLLAAKAYGDARARFPDNPRVIRAQTQWLLDQKRAGDAVDIAASFAHSGRNRSERWILYRDVCAAAKNAACLAEARGALAGFAS